MFQYLKNGRSYTGFETRKLLFGQNLENLFKIVGVNYKCLMRACVVCLLDRDKKRMCVCMCEQE